jgi:hypothetical protein
MKVAQIGHIEKIVDVLEPRAMEGGGEAGGAGDADKEAGAWRGASRYAN